VRTVIIACAVLLAAAGVLVVRRVEHGPSILDRVVALDVFVSTMLAGTALYAAWTSRLDLVPIMVVLALLGFVGAVSVARFVAAESEDERRILTAEELRAQRATRRAAEGPAAGPGAGASGSDGRTDTGEAP
jgi:multicomponent Na+:H+ antiporter subunit F